MTLHLQATNLNDLFNQAMDQLMNNKSTWDALQTPRILSYNNLFKAESLEFDFDLSKMGFTKVRWPRYVHQYINPLDLRVWLDGLMGISKRGENLFRSKDAVRRPRGHRHGSCWLGLSYRDTPPTLVLYSRVAEFPTRVALELTMVHKVGLEISEKLGHPLSSIRFVWFISSLFLSCLHMLPYLAHEGTLDEVCHREDAVGKFVKHQVDHIAKGNVKYGPTKRMAKRIVQFNAGETKSVPINDLSLWV